jgi:hypothetical protein
MLGGCTVFGLRTAGVPAGSLHELALHSSLSSLKGECQAIEIGSAQGLNVAPGALARQPLPSLFNVAHLFRGEAFDVAPLLFLPLSSLKARLSSNRDRLCLRFECSAGGFSPAAFVIGFEVVFVAAAFRRADFLCVLCLLRALCIAVSSAVCAPEVSPARKRGALGV